MDMKEFIDHRKNGFLLDRETPDELAEILVEALNTPDLLQKMGDKAKRDIRKLYLGLCCQKNA